MGKPAKLAHVVLRTRDVQRLSDWYCKALDAHPTVHQPPTMIFITYDDEHHRLGFIRIEGDGDGDALAAPGMSHMAFTYPSAHELLETYSALKGQGVPPAATIHHGPTLSAYYRDPDGNVVELFADVFQTAADSDAFMQSPEFAANPVGKPADFEALLAKAQAGASEAELLAYPAEAVDPWALARVLAAAMEGRA